MNGIVRMNYTTITCPQGHEKSIRTELYRAMKFVGSCVRCSKCIELFEITIFSLSIQMIDSFLVSS